MSLHCLIALVKVIGSLENSEGIDCFSQNHNLPFILILWWHELLIHFGVCDVHIMSVYIVVSGVLWCCAPTASMKDVLADLLDEFSVGMENR